MLDFEVQRCSRRCCRTDQALKPGDTFYSALVAEGAEVVRRDYCEQAWQGPPDGTIGWWKSVVVEPESTRMRWAPNDVIFHCFEQLEERAAQPDMRYVLALLMIRRRIMRLEEIESDERGNEVLAMFCPRDEREYRVAVVVPTGERVQVIQHELANLLFSDQASS